MNSVLRLLGFVLAPVLLPATLAWLGPLVTVAGTFVGIVLVGLLIGMLIRSWWSTAYMVALGLVWIFYTIATDTGSGELPLSAMILVEVLVGMLPASIGAAIGTVLGQRLEERWTRSYTADTA